MTAIPKGTVGGAHQHNSASRLDALNDVAKAYPAAIRELTANSLSPESTAVLKRAGLVGTNGVVFADVKAAALGLIQSASAETASHLQTVAAPDPAISAAISAQSTTKAQQLLGTNPNPALNQTPTTKQAQVVRLPPADPKQKLEAQVMFVGTGIGGGPAAARLAEQGFQVKCLEKGPPQRDWFDDVALLGPGQNADNQFAINGYNPPMSLLQYFVDHYTTQQNNVDLKFHEELGGILYPRGQGIGGSGNVNANVGVMPDRSTLDALYVHSGKDPRFAPANLEKFFARAQDGGPVFNFLETLGHVLCAREKVGIKDLSRVTEDGGWQKLTRADPRLLLADKQLLKVVLHIAAFTNNPANVSLPDILTRIFTLFDSNNDLNQGREGFTLMPMSVTKEGRRSSVADRIKDVMHARPDTLSVECEATVHSLILNDKGTHVEGVRVLKPNPEVLAQRQVVYRFHQQTRDVAAKDVGAHNQKLAVEIEKLKTLEATTKPLIEVQRSATYVLAAGAFEDPAIVLRTNKEREAQGLPPIGGTAVGANLKDRREISVLFHAKDKFALLDGLKLSKTPDDDAAMKVWEKSGRGAYGSNGVVASYQFKSDPRQPDSDIFAFFVPVPFRGYTPGFSTDAERYPQTFSAVLLDKNGVLVSDDSRLMTPQEFEKLRGTLGKVELDPADEMKLKVNFNYQRPGPGETPALYNAMLKMQELFAGCDILTETVPGNPFSGTPTTSMKAALLHLQTGNLFPSEFRSDDIRQELDWFKKLDVAVFDKQGNAHQLTLDRAGSLRLLVDGKPATEDNLGSLKFYGGVAMNPENLVAQLQREYLMEYQHSQQWGHHANGTVSMGPDPDNNVVGTDYRFHGIDNLYCMSAAATPAALNPGPFIQLYIAAMIGEAGGEALTEQLKASESRLGTMSPLATRMSTDLSKHNTLGENLVVALDRARGHIGDTQGVLTGPAMVQLIALQKDQGFSTEDLAMAAEVARKAEARSDPNASVLRILASEVRRLKQDQGFMLDFMASWRSTKGHMSSAEVVAAVLDDPGKSTTPKPQITGDW